MALYQYDAFSVPVRPSEGSDYRLLLHQRIIPLCKMNEKLRKTEILKENILFTVNIKTGHVFSKAIQTSVAEEM